MSDDQLKTLYEERAKVWQGAKDLIEEAQKAGRDLTTDEKAEYDKRSADLDQLDQWITQRNDFVERARENDVAKAAYEAAFPASHEDRGNDQPGLADWFRGGSGPKGIDLDIRQVAQVRQTIRAGGGEREARDLLKVTSAAGGYTVPTSFLNTLYDFLEVYSGVRRTNVRVITTSGGENLDLPTVASHGTAAIVGESTALAENDPTFGKVTLGAWKYGQLLQVSNELLADTGVDILSFIAQDMGRALGRATDTDYVTGTGSSKPQGLVGQYATGVTGQASATGLPSYANLVDMVYSINEEYRQNAMWLFKDATVGKIRGITDSTGLSIWQPALTEGTPDRLLGKAVHTDPNVNTMSSNTGLGLFGDFSGFAIRDVGTIRIERSDDFAFSQDLVTFRGIIRTDSKIVDSLAVRVYKGGS